MNKYPKGPIPLHKEQATGNTSAGKVPGTATKGGFERGGKSSGGSTRKSGR